MDYDLILYKPRSEDGIIKDLSFGYYLKLSAADQVHIKAGDINGIPQRWGLIGASLALDTDANVADRYLYLLTYNKLRHSLGGIASHKFTANQANSWTIGQAMYMNAATIAQGSYTGIGPEGLTIEGLQYHEIWLANAQAGDKWHVDLTYKYLGEGNTNVTG